MSPLTFLELEAALLLAGLLAELAIAALVLRHDRRTRERAAVVADALECSGDDDSEVCSTHGGYWVLSDECSKRWTAA